MNIRSEIRELVVKYNHCASRRGEEPAISAVYEEVAVDLMAVVRKINESTKTRLNKNKKR